MDKKKKLSWIYWFRLGNPYAVSLVISIIMLVSIILKVVS